MQKRLRIGWAVILIGLAAFAGACGSPPGGGTAGKPQPSTGATAQARLGKTLYTGSCAQCHKADATGGRKIGQATSADLRWSALDPAYRKDKGLLERAILEGKDEEGAPLDQAMPRWGGQLTKAQADAIIAYLKTLG